MASRGNKPPFNFAPVLLCGCMFASGACGIILEYIQASLASMILGNSFEQWAMVIGLMLFWMGLGSLIQARIPKPALIWTFIGIETGLALTGGFSPTLTYLSFGHTAHYPLVLYTFVCLIGIMIGLEIPVIIRINNDYSRELSTNLGNILSADYIGSLVGALVYVFFLLKFFPVNQAAFLTAGINFSLAFVTFVYFSRKNLISPHPVLFLAMTAVVAALGLGYLKGGQWQVSMEQPLYDDPVVFTRTTRYQHIVITHYRPLNETRLFLNGNLQMNSLDEDRYHESLVHPAMNLVPRRRRVLILGGGDGCALREVLKYTDVEQILLVDLDPAMTELASSHPLLTQINRNAFQDSRLVVPPGKGVSPGEKTPVYVNTRPGKKGKAKVREVARVHVMNVDADLFLSRVPGFWDLIIADLPDPSSPELAKLYSRQFYAKIRQKLSKTGMAVIQATSPYFAKQSFLCIGRTLEAAGFSLIPFHENVPSFGDWGWYLARHPALGEPQIREKIKGLDIPVPTRFITPEVFRSQLTFGKGMLDTKETSVNTLLYPVLLTLYNNESWLTE